MSATFAIGVGCRKDCPAALIEAIIRQALGRVPGAGRAGLFTIADKRGEEGLTEAARRLGLDLMFLSRDALRAQASLVSTPSVPAEGRFGVPSVAEAAALAGAGRGAALVVARIANRGATCAIASAPVDPS